MTDNLTTEERATLETYQRIAEKWNKTHGDADYWRSQFIKFQKYLPSGKVVDLGCGGGRDASLFLESGNYQYIGIDISQGQINEAKNVLPNVDFRCMSMYKLDFSPNSFDGFWAAASFLHIPKKKIAVALKEAKRVLKPGAIGFISVKEGEGEQMIADEAGNERLFAFYQKDEFASLLEKNGFKVLESLRDFCKYNPPKNLTIWLVYFVKAV